MKQQILIIAFVLTVVACKNTNQQQNKATTNTPVLIASVIDYSLSCSQISYFDSSNAQQLIYALARHGGALIPIAVLDNSTTQSIKTFTVPKLDTESTNGIKNPYQLAKIQARNKKKLSAFQEQTQELINDYTAHTLKPNEAKHTDLQNALDLSAMAVSESVYADYQKVIMILGDMQNDPPNSKSKALRPIHLPNTTILFVRPALNKDSLQAIFPESEICLFANTNDAIQMIHNFSPLNNK